MKFIKIEPIHRYSACKFMTIKPLMRDSHTCPRCNGNMTLDDNLSIGIDLSNGKDMLASMKGVGGRNL